MSTSQPSAPPPLPPAPPRPPGLALLPGALIVVLGLAFLANNLGLLHFRLWCLWPLILVVVGLVKMTCGNFPSFIWGAVIAAFGAGLTLDCFNVLPFHFWLLWPVFLIGVGVIWLWGASRPANEQWLGPWMHHRDWAAWHQHRAQWRAHRMAARAQWRAHRHGWPPSDTGRAWWAPPVAAPGPGAGGEPIAPPQPGVAGAPAAPSAAPLDDNWLQLTAVFTGVNRRVYAPAFRGASLFAFFGGCNLDLRPIGPVAHTVIVDAHAVFGGIEVYVPSNWSVAVEGAGIFGAFEDQTRPPISLETTVGRLILRGEAVFGGVVVKN